MTRPSYSILFLAVWTITSSFICCGTNADNTNTTDSILEETTSTSDEDATNPAENGFAVVTAVTTSGNANSYTFGVTISSPDTSCDQYADWWEVLDMDGNLLYRRILAHSHVNEQPFTRSGGTVAIQENTEVYVRAHMNNTGYGRKAMKGSAGNGFESIDLDSDFASDAATRAPLPNGCAF